MLLAGSNKEKQIKALKELEDAERAALDGRIGAYQKMYSSFVDFAKDATDKEKDARKELIDIEKEISEERERYAIENANIELSLVDKINAVKKASLGTNEKQTFIEAEAIIKLKQANESLNIAIQTKDAAALATSKKLYNQSLSLFSSFDDQEKAIDGITKASNGLKKVETENHKIKLKELEKEKKEKLIELKTLKLQLVVYEKMYEAIGKIVNKILELEGVSSEITPSLNFEQIHEDIAELEKEIEGIGAPVEKTVKTKTTGIVDTEALGIGDKGFSWIKQYNDGIQQAIDNTLTWKETLFEIGNVIADNLTGGIMDWIDGTKSAKESMKDFAKSTIKWLAEIIIKQQILNALQGMGGAIGGGFGGFLSGIAGARADGGPVTGNKTYLVGERGPELFTPKTSGTITSNDKMAPNVVVNIIDKTTEKKKVTKRQPEFDGKRWVTSIVLESASQDPSFARNLGAALGRV